MNDGRSHNKRILFAAGGTGGHIYPAIAVGEAIREKAPEVDIMYICGSRKLEIDLYKRNGIEPTILDVQPLRSGLVSKVKGMVKLIKGFWSARRLLKRWKPGLIMGLGGYVTAPTLLAARTLSIPYDLQEQNAVPGRTNLWFSKRARTVYCSFREAMPHFKNGLKPRCVFAGMPLRKDLFSAPGNTRILYNHFRLREGLPVVLILGGSQGAKRLYQALIDVLYELDRENSGCVPFQCLWSTGNNNYQWITKRLEEKPLFRIHVSAFCYIDDMADAYQVANLAVSRAGAGSVTELMVTGIPSIFVPLPHAVGDHQNINAGSPERKGASITVRESDLGDGRLGDLIKEIVSSETLRSNMSKRAVRIFPKNAAKYIAKEILKKLKNNS